MSISTVSKKSNGLFTNPDLSAVRQVGVKINFVNSETTRACLPTGRRSGWQIGYFTFVTSVFIERNSKPLILRGRLPVAVSWQKVKKTAQKRFLLIKFINFVLEVFNNEISKIRIFNRSWIKYFWIWKYWSER